METVYTIPDWFVSFVTWTLGVVAAIAAVAIPWALWVTVNLRVVLRLLDDDRHKHRGQPHHRPATLAEASGSS